MYVLAFLFVLITPAALFAIGTFWRIHPPKQSGHSLSYRTSLSSRSPETWAFAHQHISRIWQRMGLMLGIVSAVLMVLFRESYQNFVLWLVGGQMAFLCLSAFLVDTALKNGFDEAGTPFSKR